MVKSAETAAETAVDGPVIVYSTFGSKEEAGRIGGVLVTERLAACVNMFPGTVSIYEWQGEISMDKEVAMIVKTRRGLAGRVMEKIGELHSYDNPSLLVLPVSGGGEAFLGWIMAETGAGV